MTTTLNVHEAKANFSGVLSQVESEGSSFIIMKYGHPIARILPIMQTRRIRPLPGYGAKIRINGDIFADDTALWENA